MHGEPGGRPCGWAEEEETEKEEEEEGEGLTEAEQQIYDTIPDLYNTNWEIDGGGGAGEGGSDAIARSGVASASSSRSLACTSMRC